MQLPPPLRAALEDAVRGFTLAELEREAAKLSDAYRAGRPPKLDTEPARAAYAVVRMPATYAAARLALRELPAAGIESANDLGAGFGAGAWAIHEALGLGDISLLERNAALLDWARNRLRSPGTPVTQDLNAAAIPEADLQLFSYSLGELSEAAQSTTVEKAWRAARRALVVVEPGRMAGFAVVRRARETLIALGAHVAAPCPHPLACPVQAGDWCHFAARVERTALHRRLKGGTLGHEDEKFSYVVVTREPAERAAARIVRHPQQRPGLIQLTLCQHDGALASVAVRQKDKDTWRDARKAEWGSRWPPLR